MYLFSSPIFFSIPHKPKLNSLGDILIEVQAQQLQQSHIFPFQFMTFVSYGQYSVSLVVSGDGR